MAFQWGAAAKPATPAAPFGTTNVFGAPSATPATPFGAPAATAPAAPSFGFGTTPAATAPPATPFGAPAPAPTTTFGFGTAPTAGTSTGLFGATTTPAAPFGAAPLATTTSVFGAPAAPSAEQQTLDMFKRAYDPSNPSSTFLYFVYNELPPGRTADSCIQEMQAFYRTSIHDYHWLQARQSNPDPSAYYPAPMRSFKDLEKRMTDQKSLIAGQSQRLETARQDVEKMRVQLEAKKQELEQAKREQNEHEKRIVRAMRHVEAARLKTQPITHDEAQTFGRIAMCEMALHQPNQFRGKLNELHLALEQLDSMQRAQLLGLSQVPGSDQAIQQLTEFLGQQRKGISVLVETLQKDMKDMNFVLQELSKGHR